MNGVSRKANEMTQLPIEECSPIAVKDVFVPGGFPKYTYQNRDGFHIESNFNSALKRLNKFIAIAGPTKSGKTVLIRRMVPRDKSIWIESGHITTAQDFWNTILSELNVPTSVVESQLRLSEDVNTTEIAAGFKPGGIGAETKNQNTKKASKSNGTAATYGTPSPKTLLERLVSSKKTVVIDDFHYLDQSVQTTIIRALKPAVFDGLKVVLLLIPHRMHQAAQAEIDVDGRTHTISIPDWQASELFSIAESGFNKLNLRFSSITIHKLVSECFGSPHLMQDFCSSLCFSCNIEEEYLGNPPLPSIAIPLPEEEFFKDLASNISPEAFKALRRGPPRTNRNERAMCDGGKCDTYEAVLLALHQLEGTTPINWAALRGALQGVLKDVPQQHEVTRALEKMDEIAKNRKGEPVIDYMKSQGELHLVDPFFRFFLKWNTLILDEAKVGIL